MRELATMVGLMALVRMRRDIMYMSYMCDEGEKGRLDVRKTRRSNAYE